MSSNAGGTKPLAIGQMLQLLWRALRLRCPRCGRGRLFLHGFRMYERCTYCDWRFEREEGYWTGAMAVNLVATELLVTVVIVPLAAMQAPIVPVLGLGIPAAIVLPILMYRHSKGFWMAIDFIIHPVSMF